jgi:5-(carboxyamino)imidazole ribonucleotide mutase
MKKSSKKNTPVVGVLMGSRSDWSTMQKTVAILKDFGVPCEAKVISAHRSTGLLMEYVKAAEDRGIQVLIAGAGCAAHLPGVVAALTTLPVLGVPMQSAALNGMDSLLSIVQMPGGIPVGTLAIGDAGAKNAALLAIAFLANNDADLKTKLRDFRAKQSSEAAANMDVE